MSLNNGNDYFEFSSSNFDDSVIPTSEEFSNFRFLGIGKPTKKQTAKKAERKEKREVAKEERQDKGVFARVANVAVKFNPAAAIVRAGTLAGIRLNIFGIARKLYPALLSESQLKAKNFDLQNAKNAKAALDKVHKFYFTLGGRSVTFDNAIKKGWDKPIFKTKKLKEMKAQQKSSFVEENPDVIRSQMWESYPVAKRPYFYGRTQGKGDGIEFEPASNFNCENLDLPFDGDYYSNLTGAEETALISAGISSLATITGLIAKMVKDNPYQQGTNDYSLAQSEIAQANSQGDNTPPPVNQEELNKTLEQAKEDMAKGGDPMGDESYDKILGMSKPIFWTVTGLVSVAIIGLVIWKVKGK